jgi:AcrR family transcriptional regulator
MAEKSKRRYHAPSRAAAAAETRDAVVAAAKRTFEARGWSGATMAAIGADAGVSPKTIEALFGTKATLLKATVDYAIRGDAGSTPVRRRPVTTEMEAAPDAATMLNLHAAHLRRANERAAPIAFVVEHAAHSDPRVAELWGEINRNREYGVQWAARTLLAKPATGHLDRRTVERIFWVALDWGTYRLLTDHAGLDADEYQQWIADYYRRMFFPSAQETRAPEAA